MMCVCETASLICSMMLCSCRCFLIHSFKWRFIRSLFLWHNNYNASIKSLCSYTRCTTARTADEANEKEIEEKERQQQMSLRNMISERNFEAEAQVKLHQLPEMEHLFIINNEFLNMHQRFSFNFVVLPNFVWFFFCFILNMFSIGFFNFPLPTFSMKFFPPKQENNGTVF